MKVSHILGVMSGSSLDAIDFALVRFTIEGEAISDWKLLETYAMPLAAEWKTRLAHLPGSDLQTFFQTDAEFGKLIGIECKSLIAQWGILPEAISSHGHTVLHDPDAGYSVQIGNPAGIAFESGCSVISGLRNNDIAAGGQGAPLAPVAERYLFPGYDFYLNLGGIANLSNFIQGHTIRAWDIAPANQLLNYLAGKAGLPFDNGGMLARNGRIQETLLTSLKEPIALPLHHPFSLDNTWVQNTFFPLIENAEGVIADKLATITEFIAYSVGAQINGLCSPQEDMDLFVTGGGAHNKYLMERIAEYIAPVQLVVPDSGVIDFKEAMLMAICGMLRLLDKPNAFASVTGAAYDTVNGSITPAQINPTE